MTIKASRPNPTLEDILRAAAYAAIMTWAVLFTIFPPSAYVDTTDVLTRGAWMLITFSGATLAFLGAIFRIDLKLELPGLVVTIIGPAFYFAAQIWYIYHPPVGSDPYARIALAAYALLPLLLILPRVAALYGESRRLKRINSSPLKKIHLTDAENGQPGAGFSDTFLSKGDSK